MAAASLLLALLSHNTFSPHFDIMCKPVLENKRDEAKAEQALCSVFTSGGAVT